jgi:hypothetical protein
MEQAKEKVLIFILVFHCFCEIIFRSRLGKEDLKNNSKNILDICTGTEFSL